MIVVVVVVVVIFIITNLLLSYMSLNVNLMLTPIIICYSLVTKGSEELPKFENVKLQACCLFRFS